jgi:acyl carrier protein
MSDRVAAAVFAALGRQLGQPGEAIAARANEGLDVLGLDSHGLMRVLLDLEQALGLSGLELSDDALATPASMVHGVAAAAG